MQIGQHLMTAMVENSTEEEMEEILETELQELTEEILELGVYKPLRTV